MVEGWSSPVSGMTGAEIRALLIGETASNGLGLIAEFRSARAKLTAAADSAALAAETVGQRFLVDATQWFSAPEQPRELPAISRAVWTGRRITVVYRAHGREPVSRRLDPLGLVLKTDLWYLVAAHRKQPRTYRVSRMERVKVHDEGAVRPAEFSLSDYWAAARAEFDSAIRTTRVRLSIPTAGISDLRRAVPGPATETAIASGTIADGRMELELGMETAEIAASQLVTVPGVEIRAPADLRRRLWAHGQELVAYNSDS